MPLQVQLEGRWEAYLLLSQYMALGQNHTPHIVYWEQGVDKGGGGDGPVIV